MPAPRYALALVPVILVFVTVVGVVRANHAGIGSNDQAMVSVVNEMITAANAILATVSEGPGGIENAVGYNRQELLHLDFSDSARTNYVYWPYLRKGLPLDYMSA